MTTGRGMVLSAALLAVVLVFVHFAGSGSGPQLSTRSAVTSGVGSGSAPKAFASESETPGALSVRGTEPVRIVSSRTITASVRQMLSEKGVRVIAPLGARAVVAEVTPSVRRALAAEGDFAVTRVDAGDKVQRQLARLCAKTPDEAIPVSVIGLSEADRAGLAAWVVARGGTVVRGPQAADVLCANVTAATIDALAERGDVRWIEYAPPRHLMNDLTAATGASGVAGVRDNHLLCGEGQTVVVCDSGFDKGSTTDCHADFSGRVKRIYNVGGRTSSDYNGHGTHVAGTVLGDGASSDGQYKGMAPAATLLAMACGDTAGSGGIHFGDWSYERILTTGLAQGAYIHSDSWGEDSEGAYLTDCRDFDEVIWKHPELLVVVAAGNAGQDGKGSVGSPAASKNVLTVGNAQSTRKGSEDWGLPASPENLNPSSSRGPTQDDRIKPDVAAPGTEVISTRSSRCSLGSAGGNRQYTKMTGTSMATPLVSGAAALVRQWLAERRDYEGLPTAALVKAILTGGGDLMKGRGAYYGRPSSGYDLPQYVPNNDEGWGRINLEETLYPTGRAVKYVDRIPFADGKTECIDVTTTNAAPLDVQLVWIDYKGDPSEVTTLVNDLDLIVSNKTTGVVWRGNNVADGDHVNTVESVRIPSADAGDYAVLVVGTAVAYDSTQGGAAAVYVRGAFEDETSPDPAYVRIEGKGSFVRLEDALAVASAGDTVELLQPIDLRKPVTVGVDVTLIATNETASLSSVTRVGDVGITVAPGATLTLSNIVFSESVETLVTVKADGCLVLGAGAELGISPGYVAVETADAGGLSLAASLTRSFMLKCESARAADQAFGTYTCPQEVAEAEAVRISNYYDETLELRGRAVGGGLVWSVSQVPLEDAAGYYVDKDGNTNTYGRLDRVFERFDVALREGALAAAKLVVRKSGSLSYATEIASSAEIVGENGAEITTTGTNAFRIVAGGSLMVSNLVFKGGVDETCVDEVRFIRVDGGDLTLARGAVIRDMIGRADRKSGIIDLEKGSVALLPGSAIRHCKALGLGDGNGCGGAIYVRGGGCALNLEGGEISDCYASYYGGGVYAYGLQNDAGISVSGVTVVSGNRSKNRSAADNIYVLTAAAYQGLRLTGTLGGKIGIGYYGKSVNAADRPFMTNAFGAVDETTLHALSCDVDSGLVAAANAADGTLVWAVRPAGDGQCAPMDATALLVGADGVTNYYETVGDAFAYMGETSPYVVELRSVNALHEDVTVLPGRIVTLRTAADLEPADCRLTRAADVGFVVPAGAELRLTNVIVSGEGDAPAETRSKSFFAVAGGSLALQNGAVVRDVTGIGSRMANAVTVYEGGEFRLEDGAAIVNCRNVYSYDPANDQAVTDYGVGGALLVDGVTRAGVPARAYLTGGMIANCRAGRGGAVCVCNGAEVHVAGAARIEPDSLSHANDFVVEDLSKLFMDGVVTGYYNMTPGVRCDRGFIGYVAWDWAGDVDTITNCAARFVHSVVGDHGMAVTNCVDATDVLLVWCNAVRGGAYTNAADEVYCPVVSVKDFPVATSLPPLASSAARELVAEALAAAPLADASVGKSILASDDAVGAYMAFRDWAQDVSGGINAVMTSRNAGVSYAFGTGSLLESAPSVEIAELAQAPDGMTVRVAVRDGGDMVAVAADKVLKMFEATCDMSDWSKKLDLSVRPVGQNADKSVTFKVGPAAVPSAFIRLRY